MSSVQLLNFVGIRQLALSRRHSSIISLVNPLTNVVSEIMPSCDSLSLSHVSPEGIISDTTLVSGFTCSAYAELTVLPLEILDAFLVLEVTALQCDATFISVGGHVTNTVELKIPEIVSMDYFQNRMELVIGLGSGKVLSITIRRQTRFGEERHSASTPFQMFPRLSTQLQSPLRPVQVRVQDVMETFLVLVSDGSIRCLDAASFDTMWQIPSHVFYSPPKDLIADRLSSHFLIYCEATAHAGPYSVEHWFVPTSFSYGASARFSRASMQLKDRMCAAQIESIGKGMDYFVALLLETGSVHVYRLSEELDRVYFETKCDLPLSFSSTNKLPYDCIQFVKPSRGCPSSGVAVSIAMQSHAVTLTLHCLQNDPSPYSSHAFKQRFLTENAVLFETDPTDLQQFNFPTMSSHSRPKVSSPLEWMTDEVLPDYNQHAAPTSAPSQTPSPQIPPLFLNNTFPCAFNNSKTCFYLNPASVLRHSLQDEESSKWSLRYLSKHGLHSSTSVLQLKSNMVQPTQFLLAPRANAFIAVTASGPCYFYSLDDECGFPLEFEEWGDLPNDKCASHMLADVAVVMSASSRSDARLVGLSSEPSASHLEPRHSNYTLACFGDDLGRVCYVLSDGKQDVQIRGSFEAHSSAVVAIVALGDSVHPLVNVGVEFDADSFSFAPVPGSGIITLTSAGEMKVWTLVMSSAAAIRGDDVLARADARFTLSGLITPSFPWRSITTACLDPTCMSIICSFQDGGIAQWQVPGLVSYDGAFVRTCIEPLQSNLAHTNTVTAMRVWVEGQTTVVRTVNLRQLGKTPLAVCYSGPAHFSVGYTLPELRLLQTQSTMATCAEDLSAVLWTFVLDAKGDFTYLTPLARQRFVFSSHPCQGLCSYNTSAKWQFEAIVGGNAVIADMGSTNQLDRQRFKVDDQEYATTTRPYSMESPEDLQMIPVVTEMHKPLYITSALSRIQKQEFFSWEYTHYLYLQRTAEEFRLLQLYYKKKREEGSKLLTKSISTVQFGSSLASTRYVDKRLRMRYLANGDVDMRGDGDGGADTDCEESVGQSALTDSDSLTLQSHEEAEAKMQKDQKEANRERRLQRVREAQSRRASLHGAPKEVVYLSKTSMLKIDTPSTARRPVERQAFTGHYDAKLRASLQKVVVGSRVGPADPRLEKLKGLFFESSIGGTQHNKTEHELRRQGISDSRPASTSHNNITRDSEGNIIYRPSSAKSTPVTPGGSAPSNVTSTVRVPTGSLKAGEVRVQSGRVSVEVKAVFQHSVDLKVHVADVDKVILVVLPSSSPAPTSADMRRPDFAQMVEGGLLQSQDFIKVAKRKLGFQFGDLLTSHKYKVYYNARSISGAGADDGFNSDEEIQSTAVEFATLIENLDIEWMSLSDYMREQEVLAACKDTWVHKYAIAAKVALPLPAKLRAVLSKTGSDPIAEEFIAWWWGNKPSAVTKHRHEFLNREVEFAVRSDFFKRQLVIEQRLFTEEEYSILAAGVADTKSIEWLRFQQLIHNRNYFSFTADPFVDDTADSIATEDDTASFAVMETGLEQQSTASFEDESLDKGSVSDVSRVSLDPRKVLEKLYLNFRSWFKGGDEAFLLFKRARSSSSQSVSEGSLASTHAPTELDGDLTMASVMKLQLTQRTAMLNERVSLMQQVEGLIAQLIEQYGAYTKQNLKYDDLFSRRMLLTDEEITLIMAAAKLLSICVANGFMQASGAPIGVTRLGYMTLQEVSGMSVFALDCSTLRFTPDEPPLATVVCLPGTQRRPVKPWHMCSINEKWLEVSVACMIDYIAELAVRDGVLVPDAEDSTIDAAYNRSRSATFARFWAWYAGDEETNPQKGFGIPSQARVLIAERLERPLVDKDYTVGESLFALPQFQGLQDSIQNSRAIYRADASTSSDDDSILHGIYSRTISGLDEMTNAYRRRRDEGNYVFSELVKAYEQAVFSAAGVGIRVGIFKRQLEMLITSRKLGVMKYFWPPANSDRLCQRFIFPRIGLLAPQFSVPQKRYKLYASRINVGYTFAEIDSWYNADDGDDKLLREAEREGQKKQEYLVWLSKAEDRLVESRSQMVEEDRRSRLVRYFTKKEEARLANLGNADVVFDPHEFEKLFYDIDTMWLNGSGLDNDDEIKEYQVKILRAQEEQEKREQEIKAWLDEQHNKKAALEEARLQQIEKERVIAERAEERIRLRKHYAHLKEAKRIQAEEKQLERILNEQNAQRQQLEIDAQRREEERLAKIESDMVSESAQMAAEEESQRRLLKVLKETVQMEHEDIRSLMVQRLQEQRDEKDQRIFAMAQVIYEPFEPYVFKKRRALAPHEVAAGTKPLLLSRSYESLGNAESRLATDFTNTIAASVETNDRLSWSLALKMNASASLLTLTNESASRVGLHSARRNKRLDAEYLRQLEEAVPAVELLSSMPSDFEADYFYLEACRPGIRDAAFIESPIQAPFSDFPIIRKPSPGTLLSPMRPPTSTLLLAQDKKTSAEPKAKKSSSFGGNLTSSPSNNSSEVEPKTKSAQPTESSTAQVLAAIRMGVRGVQKQLNTKRALHTTARTLEPLGTDTH